MRRLLSRTLLVLAGTVLFSAAPRSEVAQPIRIAVEGAFPPFNYIDQGNELAGFEVDLAKALCEAMRRPCTLVQHEWDGIIRGLLNRDYDAIMSSLAITPRRQQRIAFSRRYYLMPWALLGPKEAEPLKMKIGTLAGKRIGITERREHIAYLENVHKGAEIRTYGRTEDAILDMKVGRVDYVLADKLGLVRFLASRESECCRIVADVPNRDAYQGQGIAIGLRKEDEALKAAFDRAIEETVESGAYDRIRARYFPFDIK